MEPAFADKPGMPELVPFRFKLIPAHKPDELHANMRSSIARKLPVVLGVSPANDMELCVVGGGPSANDTLPEIRKFVDEQRGYAAAINGTLKWLLDNGVVPTMCGVCDPSPHMAGIVHADPRVTYFLASSVHPSVYDKLIDAGCRIYRWNISSVPNGLQVLDKIEPNYHLIGGGSTMGLRWLTLGYTLGFRKFHLHGYDSSFRIDPNRGKASHAYPDHQDQKEWITFDGYATRVNFIGQLSDFIGWMDLLMGEDVDEIELHVHGDGLLQSKFAEWRRLNPGCHEGHGKPKRKGLTDDFVWPEGDTDGRLAILEQVKAMDRFLAYVPRNNVVVQAGGNVGVYPAHLAQHFQHVFTFEPAQDNYDCLVQNVGKVRGNIRVFGAALGERDTLCQMLVGRRDNCGTPYIGLVSLMPENEPIDAPQLDTCATPMRRIDSLDLLGCDLIWLDIEGHELQALKGAEATIEKFWPAVIVEDDDGLTIKQGNKPGAAIDWLHDHGYVGALKIGNDQLFLPTA